jgi:hypothetical protein
VCLRFPHKSLIGPGGFRNVCAPAATSGERAVPETRAELEELMAGDLSHSKMKFCSRIMLVLQYTSLYRDEFCGAFWFQDRSHFITHLGHLCSLLHVKHESVARAFADHFFQREAMKPADVSRFYGFIEEADGWAMTWNTLYRWNDSLTDAQVDQIPVKTRSRRKPSAAEEILMIRRATTHR